MATKNLDQQLSQLEACRYHFGRHEAAGISKLLKRLDAVRFTDPSLLLRFHETLLFLRAFPQGPSVVRATERILNHFHKKVEALRKAGADMNAFDTYEFSGIAGTDMEDTLSFDVARWLIKSPAMRRKVEIAWDNYEPGRELGTTGPRFIPLLEDDANVEADTPWRQWLESAGGRDSKTPEWLISRFEQLPLPPHQQAELYDSLRIPLRWSLNNSTITRTRNFERNSEKVREVFYQTKPLIARSQVSLAAELSKRPPKLTKLSRKLGEEIIELIREVMLVRYRELYGTTLGDPNSVFRADLQAGLGMHEAGRGITIYLWNLPPDRRLPLRAYVAGLTLKNGVPINYIEAIALCEWMEVGFNTFYTFRGGEAGWIYAQVLRCLCHHMGTICVSVYPYQLGHDNDEAIESGAFWFYRKLGFRPGRADLQRLAEQEEKKIAASQNKKTNYRTPARILKRLAAGHVFYDLQGNNLPGSQTGAWDNFSTRHIGLRVNRRMARDFNADANRMRQHSTRALEKLLGLNTISLTPIEQSSFENFALVLAEIPDARKWTEKEKADLVQIIRAKAKPDEMLYLHLTQRHARLRKAFLSVGNARP